jgi:magnesium chelatase subunit D
MRFFPFSALVGQPDLKTALLISAVAPEVGGILIFGRKGTAKSTAVRSLTNVLPDLEGVADCPFFCSPNSPRYLCKDCAARLDKGEELPLVKRPMHVLTLPLNASEDRVIGYFDLAKAIKTGEKAFCPGILAEANRQILYIDEINLLNDHLVDILLDAAALGMNFVEREGLSMVHPARFTMIGTMNPEEGELRPQLLDRFGLAIGIDNIKDLNERITIMERSALAENNLPELHRQFAAEDAALREKIRAAQELYPQVKTPYEIRLAVSQMVCQELRADGHRGDIVIDCAARALAALDSRTTVTVEDAEYALKLAMAHRAKMLPSLKQAVQKIQAEAATGQGEQVDEPTDLGEVDDFEEPDNIDDDREPGMAGISRKIVQGEDAFPLNSIIEAKRDRQVRYHSGKRYLSKTSRRAGRYVRSRMLNPVSDLALDATMRAAAIYQRKRGWQPAERLILEPEDFRQKIRERKSRALLVFVIDASDSVMSKELMAATKRAVLALMQDAYQKRDKVAIITFRFASAYTILEPTNNFTQARKKLEEINVGGCTPIATGLMHSLTLIEQQRRHDPTLYPIMVLFTDGVANVGLNSVMNKEAPVRDALHVAGMIGDRKIATTIIDTSLHYNQYAVRRNEPICRELALNMNGSYFVLSQLKKQNIFEKG